MSYLGKTTKDQQADALAHLLPDDRLFEAKHYEDSNLRSLLRGLATEDVRIHDSMEEFFCNYLISNSTLFLDEWEEMLGIPDDCFPGNGTVQERQLHCLVKLASLNVKTENDWIDLAKIFGVDIQISTGCGLSGWDWVWPHEWLSAAEENFTMYIDMPTEFKPSIWDWEWDHPWGESINILQCLFQKLKPADTQLIFRFIL